MSRCRNVSSNRNDLRYCDSRPGAGDSGCGCCDSECGARDSGVSKGVAGQTAFTHMRRRSAGAGRLRDGCVISPKAGSGIGNGVRELQGIRMVRKPPKAGRFLRGRGRERSRSRCAGGILARSLGRRSRRMWHRATRPLSTPTRCASVVRSSWRSLRLRGRGIMRAGGSPCRPLHALPAVCSNSLPPAFRQGYPPSAPN